MGWLDTIIIILFPVALFIMMYAKKTGKGYGEAFEAVIDGTVGLFGDLVRKRDPKLEKEKLDEFERQIKLKERKAKLIERDRVADKKLEEVERGGRRK